MLESKHLQWSRNCWLFVHDLCTVFLQAKEYASKLVRPDLEKAMIKVARSFYYEALVHR